MHRRWYDGGATYDLNKPVIHWNTSMSCSAWLLGPRPDSVHHQFLLEHRSSAKRWPTILGRDHARMGRALAPAARQFHSSRSPFIAALTNTACPVRDPKDFTPARPSRPKSDKPAPLTDSPAPRSRLTNRRFPMEIPYTVTARPDTGLYNAKIGIWLFLASEVMLFGGFSPPMSSCGSARLPATGRTASSTCRSAR